MNSQDSQSEIVLMSNQTDQNNLVAVLFESVQIMESDTIENVPKLILADLPEEID